MSKSKRKQERKELARKAAEARVATKLAEFGVPDLALPLAPDVSISDFIGKWDSDCLEYLKNHKPKRLTKVRRKILSEQSILLTPASDVAIQETENRLSLSLPPTLLEFYRLTNGMRLDERHWLAPVEKFEFLRERYPAVIKSAKKIASEYSLPPVTDDEYFMYGNDQDENVFRYEYLENAIVLSQDFEDSLDIDYKENIIWLAVPDVRFNEGELEIWHYHAYGCGRFRSFSEAIRAHYESWQQNIVYDHYSS